MPAWRKRANVDYGADVWFLPIYEGAYPFPVVVGKEMFVRKVIAIQSGLGRFREFPVFLHGDFHDLKQVEKLLYEKGFI